MRADSHDGPEHNALQSEAGYIDARPHIRQIDINLLQHGSTAGPDNRVIHVGPACLQHVRLPGISAMLVPGGAECSPFTDGCQLPCDL